MKDLSEKQKTETAVLFNIQRFCVHDGPGIRTSLFLKGCNLDCWWCHNPESKNPHPERMYYPDKCLKCLACVEKCPSKALSFRSGRIIRFAEKCGLCFECCPACPSGATVRAGEEKNVREVFREAMKDREFYSVSGGGVTVSGGEPMLYPLFVKKLFSMLKKESVSTCIDTAGNVPRENFLTVLPHTDIFLYDFKSADGKKLKDATGGSLKLITANLEKLIESGREVIVRIPVIPGFNSGEKESGKIADALQKLPGSFSVEPVRYNFFSAGKLRALDKKKPGVSFSDRESEQEYESSKEYFRMRGFNVV